MLLGIAKGINCFSCELCVLTIRRFSFFHFPADRRKVEEIAFEPHRPKQDRGAPEFHDRRAVLRHRKAHPNASDRHAVHNGR